MRVCFGNAIKRNKKQEVDELWFKAKRCWRFFFFFFVISIFFFYFFQTLELSTCYRYCLLDSVQYWFLFWYTISSGYLHARLFTAPKIICECVGRRQRTDFAGQNSLICAEDGYMYETITRCRLIKACGDRMLHLLNIAVKSMTFVGQNKI